MSNEAILGRVQKRLPGDYVHFLHTVKRENAFPNPATRRKRIQDAKYTTITLGRYSSGGAKVAFCTHLSAKSTNPKKAPKGETDHTVTRFPPQNGSFFRGSDEKH